MTNTVKIFIKKSLDKQGKLAVWGKDSAIRGHFVSNKQMQNSE